VNPRESAGFLGVVSWKQCVLPQVVVRANDRGGTILNLKQHERIWTNYVETESDWKQSLNS
jgi:hypothetical protein